MAPTQAHVVMMRSVSQPDGYVHVCPGIDVLNVMQLACVYVEIVQCLVSLHILHSDVRRDFDPHGTYTYDDVIVSIHYVWDQNGRFSHIFSRLTIHVDNKIVSWRYKYIMCLAVE